MNRHRILGVAVVTVAAAASVTVSALLTGGHSVSLPLPQTAAHQKLPFNGGTNATGSATYTNAPPTPLTGCTVSVSNSSPAQEQTSETVTVRTTAGAQVRLQANYSRTRSIHSAVAGSGGIASFSLPITHAQPGIPVQVSATATLGTTHIACKAGFTPAPVMVLIAPGKALVPALPTLAGPAFAVVPPPTPAAPTQRPPTSSPSPSPSPSPTTAPTVPPTTTTTVPPTTTTTVPPTTTTTTTTLPPVMAPPVTVPPVTVPPVTVPLSANVLLPVTVFPLVEPQS